MTVESPTRALGNNYGAITDGRGATVALFHPSATIARITIHKHAMRLNTKRGSSEYCAMRYLLRVTLIHRQGWVQYGTLLDVLWNEVWVFLCKN